jgi:hypothetical protein
MGEGKLEKIAQRARRRRKAPKLIIGDAEEANPGQTSVQEQTITIGDVGPRGGTEGATIGRRPMRQRSTGPGVTAGMGSKSRQRH